MLTSIHPSFHFLQHVQIWLLGAGALEEKQYFPHPDHFALQGDPKLPLGQPGDIVPVAWPGSATGPSSSVICLEKLTKNVSRRHSNQRPDPPHLAPLDTEEQQL